MRGSSVANTKFDKMKQKLTKCPGCGEVFVTGKFSKNDQRCDKCTNQVSKPRSAITKIKENKQVLPLTDSFGAKLTRLASELGFQVTDKRLWRKTYAVDGGGVATVHIMVEPSVAGAEPRVDYFSYTTQRAIGANENFRKFMPPSIASDCEMVAAELSDVREIKSQIGFEKCDGCGAMTDEFGVNNSTGKILCISPRNCFKRQLSRHGAESEA